MAHQHSPSFAGNALHHHSSRQAEGRARWPLALVVALLGGCTSTPPAAVDDGPLCDPEPIAECKVNQQACNLEGAEPTCHVCAQGEFVTTAGRCSAIPGEALTHDFPEQSIGAGEESTGMCRSWSLNNETAIYVNAVQLQQDELSHHSNWLFAPEGNFDGPDGLWRCSDRDYSQLTAALAGGVLYAQSTQASREVQKFPDGVVVRIPPRSRIISDVHLLNTTETPNTGRANLTIYTVPKAEVETVLTPFHLTYDGLAIPPQSTSRFSGECDLTRSYDEIAQSAVDLDLYWLLPHTHALGTRMFVEAFGGPSDGMSLVDVRGFNGEARGKVFDPPLPLRDLTGLRFGCEFVNPRTETVHWGFDDQEMCEVLGFAATPVAFESRVEHAEEQEPDGPIRTYSSHCASLAFPFDTTL